MNDQDFKLYFLGRVIISHFLYRGLDLGKILGIQLFDQKFWYILRIYVSLAYVLMDLLAKVVSNLIF